MVTRKVSGAPPVQIGSSGIGEVSIPIPPGTPPLLRRFWKQATHLARRFGKQTEKDRADEYLKVVRKDFEDGGREG